jgi:hypothetical protein
MNGDRRNLPHPKDGGVPAGIGFGFTRVELSADFRPEPTLLQGRRRATKMKGACSRSPGALDRAPGAPSGLRGRRVRRGQPPHRPAGVMRIDFEQRNDVR